MLVYSKTDFLTSLKIFFGKRAVLNVAVICICCAASVLDACKSTQKTTATANAKTDTAPHKKTAQVQNKFDKETQEKLDRLFLDAEKAKVTEDWDDAIKSYDDVLLIDPGNADAHFQLAQIYVSKNKLSDAENEALAAIKIDIENKWYWELLASIYMNEGKAKEATETFKALVDRFPGNPDY